MEDPLHSFELHNFIPLSLFGLDISVNKAVLLMWIVVGVASLFLLKAGAARSLVPSKIQSLAELLVEFIRGIIQDTMGSSGMRYFPLISALFLFILFCNLLGLIPGSYTAVSYTHLTLPTTPYV